MVGERVRVFGIDPALAAQVRVESLVLEHQAKLARYLRRFVGDRESALDLTQDVFLAAYALLRSNSDRPLTVGWLYKVATHRAISHLRRRKRGAEVPLAEAVSPFALDERAANALDVQAALERLPADQLACVLLTVYAGYASREAGLLLGVSPEAVRQRVSRATRTMRSAMQGPV
ncbi:MAG: RNA polymerase sigma factor [Candidatus Baltobacteraceae bacterium]